MDVLVIGRPFYFLMDQLSKSRIEATYIEPKDIDQSFNLINSAKTILCIGFNLRINNSDIDLFTRVLKDSSVDSHIIFWTHEPFWDTSKNKNEIIFGRKVSFYNVYLDNVYLSPLSHYFGVGGYLWSKSRITKVDLPSKSELESRFSHSFKDKPVCAYATCFHDKRLEIEKSIVTFRNDIVKRLYDKNAASVYGKNWSGKWKLSVSEESRSGKIIDGEPVSWGKVKIENIRHKYSYSLCLENCISPNYVTEKFGHALEGFTLPIYNSGNNLSSYVDLSPAIIVDPMKSTADEILDTIYSITFSEFYTRLSELVESYNNVISNTEWVNSERKLPSSFLVQHIKESI